MSSTHSHAIGSATEHAESQQTMQAAQADRADDSMDNLALKLAEFLAAVLLTAWCVPRCGHATEQAASWIGYRCIPTGELHVDCMDIVFQEMATWSQRHEGHGYSRPELLLHNRMWYIMTRNQAGPYKTAQQAITAQSFAYWCRRVVACKTSSTATGHAEEDSTATEHGEGSASFRALAEDILTNDLTETQMQDPKCKLREGKALTRQQRSLINVILRRHLGDARVAWFLFNQPIPRLLDLPMQPDARTQALLQNMLEEFMIWYASLLQSIIDPNNHPAVVLANRLPDLGQHEWSKQRRQKCNCGLDLAACGACGRGWAQTQAQAETGAA
jgi:hypothetical protein